MKKKYNFPFGIYIGTLKVLDNCKIPLLLPKSIGGFCFFFDQKDEENALDYLENILLNIAENISSNMLEFNIFDYSVKKKFSTLSMLQTDGLYKIYYKSHDANERFEYLENLAFKRHHELLGNCSSIFDFNKKSQHKEKYYILIINIDYFPDEHLSEKRVIDFFDASYEAGIFIIAYNYKNNSYKEKSKVKNVILKKFPVIEFSHISLIINNHRLIKPLTNIIQKYKLEIEKFPSTKKSIFENIRKSIIKETINNDVEKDFLFVPIATTADGRTTKYFSLGSKSDCYHAFITGLAGSGKTTLLNSIILGIAQKYTANDIRLYLMDYKEGVEFQIFKEHPNCEKIFLDNDDLIAATNLLEKFVQLIEERGKLFTLHEVKNIYEYNNINRNKQIPRIILIIDEIQRLFSGDWGEREHLSQLLKDVVRRGRAFGIHIILSTQTLVGTDIDKELMSQITLRISFQLSQRQDAEAIFGYNDNYVPLELNKYELIYNMRSGLKDANIHCKTIEPINIKEKINIITQKREPHLIIKPEIVRSNSKISNNIEKYSNSYEEKHSKSSKIVADYASHDDIAILDKFVKAQNLSNPLMDKK